jgi:hypothetical protein
LPDPVDPLIWLGWIEPYPTTSQAECPDGIAMFCAPREEYELKVALAALQASYEQAARV